ncbi:MAG TPA: hypothetical protein ENK02_12270 [Planctomycetes bacterium]|nr:hypothetical protein [Planctomycetota bacterium]
MTKAKTETSPLDQIIPSDLIRVAEVARRLSFKNSRELMNVWKKFGGPKPFKVSSHKWMVRASELKLWWETCKLEAVQEKTRLKESFIKSALAPNPKKLRGPLEASAR